MSSVSDYGCYSALLLWLEDCFGLFLLYAINLLFSFFFYLVSHSPEPCLLFTSVSLHDIKIAVGSVILSSIIDVRRMLDFRLACSRIELERSRLRLVSGQVLASGSCIAQQTKDKLLSHRTDDAKKSGEFQ